MFETIRSLGNIAIHRARLRLACNLGRRILVCRQPLLYGCLDLQLLLERVEYVAAKRAMLAARG